MRDGNFSGWMLNSFIPGWPSPVEPDQNQVRGGEDREPQATLPKL